jgi:16S rRNA processing protein RimM
MTATDASGMVVIGQISGVWGVKGWVKVYSHTEPATAIFDYQPWLLADGRELELIEWRRQGNRLVAAIGGLDSPEQAAGLIGQDLFFPRDRLPRPEPGSYYWSDLIGLKVVNLQDHCYGAVHKVLATGANDVLEITCDDSSKILIPFVMNTYIKSVNLDEGQITVDWPLDWLEE